jgi:hypothetical protein
LIKGGHSLQPERILRQTMNDKNLTLNSIPC